jgi:hypothetical protein
MSNIGDDRAEGTSPPGWWLEKFHREYERRQDENRKARAADRPEPYSEGVVALGVKLAELVERPSPWNHSVVSNFINGKRYTREMAEAFSLHYNIPRFEKVMRAETEATALEFELFWRKYDKPRGSGNARRVTNVDQVAAGLQESAEDQITGVTSKNERTNRGRRVGRTTRRS